jgi:hypothetical protein
MKKTFQLQDSKKKPERIIDGIKNELKKYLKRERGKKLPESATYWDFDCRVGADSESAVAVGVTELNVALDKAVADKLEACYVEILVKAVTK